MADQGGAGGVLAGIESLIHESHEKHEREKRKMLNESKGNMYGFVTHTWNTVKGECPHNCSYCYMRRFKNQKPIRFDWKELNTDLGSGNFIFVGSSCDMWAANVPSEWISDTLQYCCRFRHNHYLFQTKDPSRFLPIFQHAAVFPPNTTLCVTIETNRPLVAIGSAPNSYFRAAAMEQVEFARKMVTIEPIMNFDLEEMIYLIIRCDPEQVNIGADSGNNRLPEPPFEKIINLIDRLAVEGIRVHQKPNLKRLLKK